MCLDLSSTVVSFCLLIVCIYITHFKKVIVSLLDRLFLSSVNIVQCCELSLRGIVLNKRYYYYYVVFIQSDVSPLSGISGLSFDSTLLSPLLFFCLVL